VSIESADKSFISKAEKAVSILTEFLFIKLSVSVLTILSHKIFKSHHHGIILPNY